MTTVKIRPGHVPHVLNVLIVEKSLRASIIKSSYGGYSRGVMLANMHIFDEGNTFEIVPSIDELCEDCSKKILWRK